jgi:hypothetical protein
MTDRQRRRKPGAARQADARTSGGGPADGVLLRIPVGAGTLGAQLPPVPDGHAVTVSFTSVAAAARHAEALEARGYRVVGIHPPGPMRGGEAADLLVTAALIDAAPGWWRQLARLAERAFDLSLGPVGAVFGDILRLHLRPVRPR